MKKTLSLLLVAGLTLPGFAQDAAENPLASFNHAWEEDSTWYDGKAEVATYDATRIIYEESRQFVAIIYTNKEKVDAEPTFTKSADNEGLEAFKHHVRDNIPTQNYDYHYSTMCYVGTKDLVSYKLDMGSQEDCGASFKQFIHHDGTLGWHQFSYFPDQGHRTGDLTPPAGFVFQDALSVVLRGYPFDQPRDITLHVLPDQTTTMWSPPQPAPATVSYVGQETLDLPIGQVEAHHVRVIPTDGDSALGTHDYWFAADGSAPMLHIMVKYEGPLGMSYALRALERDAYWER